MSMAARNGFPAMIIEIWRTISFQLMDGVQHVREHANQMQQIHPYPNHTWSMWSSMRWTGALFPQFYYRRHSPEIITMQPSTQGAKLNLTTQHRYYKFLCASIIRVLSESREFKFGTAVRIQFIHINRRAITVRNMTPPHMGLLWKRSRIEACSHAKTPWGIGCTA